MTLQKLSPATMPGSARGRMVRPTAAWAFLLTLMGVLPLRAQAPPSTPLLRLQYLDAQRAYPFDAVPPGALQRAKAELYGRFPFLLGAADAGAQAVASSAWESIGPERIASTDAGRLVAIAIDPRDPQVMFVGGAQGGVWKTLDGGASWMALTDDQCSLAMGSIVLDPVNPDIVYAGTGELHFSADSYYGCGVLRSLDGGASWERLGGEHFDTPDGGARISKLLIDPATAGSTFGTTVIAATSFGVYRSTDSGRSWVRVLSGVAPDMVQSPADPRRLYAAIGSTGGGPDNGVYRSNDAGLSWTRLLGGLPTQDVGRIALAIAPSSPSIVYAAVQNAFGGAGPNGTLLGIWKTTDGGVTWTRLQALNASCGSQCWYDLVIAVHPANPDLVFFGGVAMYRSLDGGGRFTNVLNNMHVDQHAIVFHPHDPSIVYVGNDGGLYRSSNAGASWVSLNTNLAISQFYGGVSLHPSDPARVLGGTQDNGTLEFGGLPDWPRVLGGDGGFTATDFLDPTVAYAETQWSAGSNFSGPRRRDGIGEFEHKVAGIDLTDRAIFIPPLVMDATDPHVLYFGTFRLYRTADRAETWTPISGDLSVRGGAISTIAPAASDPATIYVGTTDGNVVVTRDLGANWTPRRSGLPERYVRDIDVARDDPLDAVVVFSGFRAGHVFRTTDGGASWSDISGDLPDIPVNAVLRHPTLGTHIYIATDLGVFRSEDNGASWQPFGTGMPNVAVFDLVYGPATGRIVAATHGRGAFALAPVITSRVVIAPDTLRFAALDDTLTLQVTLLDVDGRPIDDFPPVLTSLDPDVVRVDAGLRIRSVANGVARVVAAAGGQADTAVVTVQQVVADIQGLPLETTFVVDESVQLDVRAVDSNGNDIADEPVDVQSRDPSILEATVDGALRALREGSTRLVASSGSFADSVAIRVEPPATLHLDVADAAAPGTVSARRGTRIPLLRIDAHVEGVEAVRIRRLRFAITGEDENAAMLLVRDLNGDGIPQNEEPMVAFSRVPLLAEGVTVELAPTSFAVPPDSAVALLVTVELGGGAPNGGAFMARHLPAGTHTENARSRRTDRLVQPAREVASSAVHVSVLGADQVLSLSENPVRGLTLIFNFTSRPRTAAVFTVGGRRVADLLRLPGEARIEWDLTNDEGARIAPGVYLLVFEIDGRIHREKLVVAVRGEDAEADEWSLASENRSMR